MIAKGIKDGTDRQPNHDNGRTEPIQAKWIVYRGDDDDVAVSDTAVLARGDAVTAGKAAVEEDNDGEQEEEDGVAVIGIASSSAFPVR